MIDSLSFAMSQHNDSPTFTEEPVVLVVEEEAAIRELLFQFLQQRGFRVYLARDGQEAVTMFSSLQWEVNVVLMDWGMEGMNGPQTLERLREMNPTLPCCFMSGGAANPAGLDAPILDKPFRLDVVIETLRKLLD